MTTVYINSAFISIVEITHCLHPSSLVMDIETT